jgi:hypothetical protein
MADCEQIRPLIFPYLEREAEPAEAIEVANHLSDCTACKILLARKRRLGQMLEEGLDDRIPVGEDFIQSVMANLPDGPPPGGPQKPKRKRRRFDLAVLFGVAVAIAHALAGGLSDGRIPGSASWHLPAVAMPSADVTMPGIEGVLRLGAAAAAAVAEGASTLGAFDLPMFGMIALLATFGAGVVAVVGSSALFALAAAGSRGGLS